MYQEANEFNQKAPEDKQAIQYIVQTACRGWYVEEDGKKEIVPDDREPPITSMSHWIPWEDGETYEEGIKILSKMAEKKDPSSDVPPELEDLKSDSDFKQV